MQRVDELHFLHIYQYQLSNIRILQLRFLVSNLLSLIPQALAKEVVLIGITAILNFAMRDKEIVIKTVNARAHYNVEQITARIIMILQIQLQTAVTEQVLFLLVVLVELNKCPYT